MANPPKVPVWTKAQRAELDHPVGLICASCHRPGRWHSSKDPEQGGDHIIVHARQTYPCVVPQRDPEVKRVIEAMVALAIERQMIPTSSVAR